MGNIAIRAEHLSKWYKIAAEGVSYYTLRDQLATAFASPFRRRTRRPPRGEATFWALNDVSLEVQQGEVIGIIGRNGAGKSTLLKIFSRITEPSTGLAEIHGRVGSLLEVGIGFHGELTGRENIYLSGAILGMKRGEIARKFDEIVAFAEIEKFIDTPAKHYSSGMFVRLAFAVAAHLEPEILLIDEVLAVGDIAFQTKCLGKMGDIAKQGRTILFVSHTMATVESLCSRAYRLDRGQLVQTGTAREVVEGYLSSLPMTTSEELNQRTDRRGNGRLRFTDIEILSADGTPAAVIQSGQDVQFSVGYTSSGGNLKNVSISVDIFMPTGQCMIMLNSQMVGVDLRSIPPAGRFCCRVNRFPLTPGHYYITLFSTVNGVVADWVMQATNLTVESGDFFGTGRLPPSTHGGFLVAQSWQLESSDVPSGTVSEVC